MKAHKFFLIIFVLLCSILACNLPRQTRTAQGIPPESLRKTLQSSSTQSPGEASSDLTLWTLVPPVLVATPVPPAAGTSGEDLLTSGNYITQPGDTVSALAKRFEVSTGEIQSPIALPESSFIPAGTHISIPDRSQSVLPGNLLLPDSELIYSPSTAGFDIEQTVQAAGGYLSHYSETVDGSEMTGSQIVQKVAAETSINPRLLLALLEYRSGWLTGIPDEGEGRTNPLGFRVPGRTGLYQELAIAATHLGIGYYDWRDGSMTSIKFADGSSARLDPRINAGTVGIQNLFAKFYYRPSWENALYGPENFLNFYQALFGDAWERARQTGPIIPDDLEQPTLELPFAAGERWSLTGGPHLSWNSGSPSGALDFSPVTGEAVCAVSIAWARAAAPGVVARADDHMLALDLDRDGFEGTGWVLVYLHLADEGLARAGQSATQDEPLGHPSCERGASTGKHVHIARKYNGEWLAADGPVPFNLGGWIAVNGARYYAGGLIRDGRQVSANPGGSQSSVVVR